MRDTTNHPGDGNQLRASWGRLEVLRRILSQLRWFGDGRVRFEKYRVAPRLGTNTVRQRLLRGIQAHTRVAATETAMP